MHSNIDPENIEPFQIPEKFLDQLFEFSGGQDESSKGFMLCFVDQGGNPMVLTRASTQIIEMGMRKALEKYLIQIEEADISLEGGNQSLE